MKFYTKDYFTRLDLNDEIGDHLGSFDDPMKEAKNCKIVGTITDLARLKLSKTAKIYGVKCEIEKKTREVKKRVKIK